MKLAIMSRRRVYFIFGVGLILSLLMAYQQYRTGLSFRDVLLGVEVPEFSTFTNVEEKKTAFFSHFRPLIGAKNKQLTQDRERIIRLSRQPELKSSDLDWLGELADHYQLKTQGVFGAKGFEALLMRVDILPSSLVLSQAAIESAWGSSRFAEEAYNYFGEWCFTKGCGLIPNARDTGAKHEIRLFHSPAQAVSAYFLNLNRHPGYRQLRQLRAQALAQGKPAGGCLLSLGLEAYSERGREYINDIRQMIRVNNLELATANDCSPLSTDVAVGLEG